MFLQGLRFLLVKPFLGCTCNCPTCACRKELHRQSLKDKHLSFEQWEKVIGEAVGLGLKDLCISGGEPTLYKHLTEMIRLGKGHGLKVTLNTNASTMTEDLALSVLEAGLDTVMISFYSPRPEVHDSMRHYKGLWQKTINAIRIFAALKSEFPNFHLTTQALISKHNYMDLAELIRLNYELGSEAIAFSYLEGDWKEKTALLNEKEIKHLTEEVIPEAVSFCKTLRQPVRIMALRTLRKLYSPRIASPEDFARGVYLPRHQKTGPCKRPGFFALVLADGKVYPCNMIEYTHYPIMGNVFESSLAEIRHSEKWKRFRQEGFDLCRFCPMPLHRAVPLKTKYITGRLRSIFRHNLPV